MKKIILSVMCIWAACWTGYAQGVQFETGTWEEILAKAKATGKTVFVDVYTQWCGPCKHVASKVFPQEKVGEYYNAHFINYKIDAESPEGKEFVKTYPVTGYPTFFFIHGDGTVAYSMGGARDADGFVQEAKMLALYEQHGGYENMMTKVKDGTADKDMLFTYYQSAAENEKPKALNLYLKSLSDEELVDANNDLIEGISLYDKDLMVRLTDVIVKTSHTERLTDKAYAKEWTFNIVFPVHWAISTYLKQSIEEGNWAWFNELLQLKERWTDNGGYISGQLLDGDLKIQRGRGLFFATPEYSRLCYWTQNKDNDEEFKTGMRSYMAGLMKEYSVDYLLNEKDNMELVKMLKETSVNGQMMLFAQHLFESGDMAANQIIAWTDYFWKISPSDKATKALCSHWIEYAFNLNPYNAGAAVPAADLLARIGNFKEAETILEKAIACQKELKNEDPKVYKNLELKLRDVNHRKL